MRTSQLIVGVVISAVMIVLGAAGGVFVGLELLPFAFGGSALLAVLLRQLLRQRSQRR